jgi:mannosylglycerate hydrolase
LKNGYYIGGALIYSDDFKGLMQTISKENAENQDLVLPVGGDQRFVDFDLRERIALANEELSGEYELVESTYEQVFAEMSEDLPKLDGEFLNGSVSKIHRSIYSSRYDQKYLNDKVERRMIVQAAVILTRPIKSFWKEPERQTNYLIR